MLLLQIGPMSKEDDRPNEIISCLPENVNMGGHIAMGWPSRPDSQMTPVCTIL